MIKVKLNDNSNRQFLLLGNGKAIHKKVFTELDENIQEVKRYILTRDDITVEKIVAKKAPEEVVEAPEEVVEAPEEVVEAPDEVVEAPDEVVEAPDEVVEAPDEVVEAPDEVVKKAPNKKKAKKSKKAED